MQKSIYFDQAATTRTDPRVVDAMLPCLTRPWASPSSIYREAQEARKRLDAARRGIAQILGARPSEVIFTSGSTEGNNLALRGAAYASRQPGDDVITSAIEHHSVLHAAERLQREGFRVTYLPVDGQGFVEPRALEKALDEGTILVSIMYGNNEVGTIEPIAELARLVKARDPHIVPRTDAPQATGAVAPDLAAWQSRLVARTERRP